MAQPLSDRKPGNLILRIRSAAVFAPAAFAAIYFGFPWFDALIALVTALMLWEWARICGAGTFGLSGWLMEAAVFAAIALLYGGHPLPAVGLLAAAAAGFIAAGLAGYRENALYLASGVLLVGAFAIAFLWLRAYPDDGRYLVIWLVLAVWLTDCGAYFAGRAIGGPRLAPRISPKKTWAGLAGGSVCSVVWSLLWLGSQSGSQSGASLALVAGVAVLTSVLAQIGDLSVSVVKRRFGVKDASGLLPGHGGVLDRLDGMLLTAPAAALALALLSAEGRWT